MSIVEEAEHRKWFRLIGRQHDLEYWTPDSRTDLQEWDREYDPSEMLPTEAWVAQLFEPIRLQYYVPPATPAIPFVMADRVLTQDDDITVLMGLDPENGGNLIEVCVLYVVVCVCVCVFVCYVCATYHTFTQFHPPTHPPTHFRSISTTSDSGSSCCCRISAKCARSARATSASSV